ncbi:unnamed protein product [Clavelina lepadiformis]|uniref:Folate receptor-like domain-containing protein n=1 Tax=Clavelina lepadiformis TaxID=159417 RepID=A0ABP0FWN0_CLALP
MAYGYVSMALNFYNIKPRKCIIPLYFTLLYRPFLNCRILFPIYCYRYVKSIHQARAYAKIMELFIAVVYLVLSLAAIDVGGDNQVLDVCLDSKHHKHAPGPEDTLFKCDSWKNHSCCTNYTAAKISQDKSLLYGFNYSHCGNMSQKCLNRFFDNHCFYECSPNVGPWIQSVNSSYRNERFKNVPLCRSQCSAWWSDCKNERTCVGDWSHGFEWRNKTNHCPSDKPCRTFLEIFVNATYFCETVFGPHDYKVTDDSSHCMKISFSRPNPNAEVAKYYASQNSGAVVNTTNNSKINDSDVIPPYKSPTDPPPLQVHGTVASLVVAILILIIVFGVLVYFGVKRFRRGRFHHQGVPVQFPNIVSTRITRQSSRSVGQDERDAEMSFMQYEEEEEDEDLEAAPEMNGTLSMEL